MAPTCAHSGDEATTITTITTTEQQHQHQDERGRNATRLYHMIKHVPQHVVCTKCHIRPSRFFTHTRTLSTIFPFNHNTQNTSTNLINYIHIWRCTLIRVKRKRIILSFIWFELRSRYSIHYSYVGICARQPPPHSPTCPPLLHASNLKSLNSLKSLLVS